MLILLHIFVSNCDRFSQQIYGNDNEYDNRQPMFTTSLFGWRQKSKAEYRSPSLSVRCCLIYNIYGAANCNNVHWETRRGNNCNGSDRLALERYRRQLMPRYCSDRRRLPSPSHVGEQPHFPFSHPIPPFCHPLSHYPCYPLSLNAPFLPFKVRRLGSELDAL